MRDRYRGVREVLLIRVHQMLASGPCPQMGGNGFGRADSTMSTTSCPPLMRRRRINDDDSDAMLAAPCSLSLVVPAATAVGIQPPAHGAGNLS